MPPARRVLNLNALADDMPDLDRHMGCMAGIFQIFDRQRLLTAAPRGRQPRHKSLPPPPKGRNPPKRSSSNVPAQSSSTPKIILEKTFSKSMTENSSLSIESSRASCSSSSCSSFSSIDASKSVQQETPYINEEPFVQRPLKNSPSLKDASADTKTGQPNEVGFRDIVKDSINRDSGGLTVKTSALEPRKNMQYKDSPRPLLLSKSMDGTYVIGIDRSSKVVPVNAVEPSRRFQEQSRFSCDDRRLLRSAETQEAKKPAPTRAKELPRLSLDSRKESLSPSSRLKNYSYRRTDDSLLDALRPQDSPSHRRSNSVIAKLMGLEEAPDATGMLIADSYEPARSPRPAEQATQSERPSRSPRSACQDQCVSLPKNEPSAPKTKPSPRILTQAAPWRQQERGASVTNSNASQCRDVEVRPRTPSLYADIERRLGGLEFLECNKDFRALRILGALNSKDAKHQNGDGDSESVAVQGKKEDLATTSSRSFESPIVVMKPARTTEKAGVSAAPLAGLRSLRKLQARDSSLDKNESSTNEKIHSRTARAQSKSEEPASRASPPRLTGSSSPRLVQRKAESERRSRPPVSPKSPCKNSNEAASPRGRTRSKPSQVKSNRDNEVSQSPRRISLAKQIDVSIMDCQKPTVVSSSSVQPNYTAATPAQKSPSLILGSDHRIHSLENVPSPVSVLDTSFYHKSISDSFKDGETHSSDECWNPNSLPDTPQSKTSSEVNQIKPENLEALIQKLEQLQSMNDEAANSKDNQYIYEILLASGLLHKELSFAAMPGQLCPSSCPINPELFLILEQTKPQFITATQAFTGAKKSSDPNMEKLHRRIVFDLVNEIIAQKMNIYSSASGMAKLLRSRKLSGCRLFKELCTEVDRLLSESSAAKCSEEDEAENMLLAEDALYDMKDWGSSDGEVQGMILDIERSIFRDLIDEVIGGEATEKMQAGQPKLRRQLSFSST